MSEEQPRERQQHPQEPAEGAEENVGAPGVDRAKDNDKAAEGTERAEHPQQPAEGGDEEVEAPGVEKADDRSAG